MKSFPATILFISLAHKHTAEDHSKANDKAVYLSYDEKTFVRKAIKVSPMLSAGDVLRNFSDACGDSALRVSCRLEQLSGGISWYCYLYPLTPRPAVTTCL